VRWWKFFDRRVKKPARRRIRILLARVFRAVYAGIRASVVIAVGILVALEERVRYAVEAVVKHGAVKTIRAFAHYISMSHELKGRPYRMIALMYYTATAAVKKAAAVLSERVTYGSYAAGMKGAARTVVTSAEYRSAAAFRAKMRSYAEGALYRASSILNKTGGRAVITGVLLPAGVRITPTRGNDIGDAYAPLPSAYIETKKTCPWPQTCMRIEECEESGGTCSGPCEFRDPNEYCCCE
jgi:hypothetical protein